MPGSNPNIDDEVQEADQQYTREQLTKKKVDELKQLLEEKNASTKGNKLELINRLLGIHEGSTAAQDDPSEFMQKEIRLTQDGARDVIDEGYATPEDLLLLLEAPNLDEALSFLQKSRDRLAIKIFLNKNSPVQRTISEVSKRDRMDLRQRITPKPDLRDLLKKRRESRVHLSDSEEEDRPKKHRNIQPGETSELGLPFSPTGGATRLPKEARLLPRPHTFIQSEKGPKDIRKAIATDLNMNEFFQGSLHVIRDIARKSDFADPDQQRLLIEYTDYIHYIASRRVRYTDDSLIQFDNEFRNLAENNDVALDDIMERAEVGDKFFHAGLRRTEQRLGGVFKQPFRTSGAFGQGASAPSHSNFDRYEHPCCYKYNDNRCQRSNCNFPHVCGNCGAEGHIARRCSNPVAPSSSRK